MPAVMAAGTSPIAILVIAPSANRRHGIEIKEGHLRLMPTPPRARRTGVAAVRYLQETSGNKKLAGASLPARRQRAAGLKARRQRSWAAARAADAEDTSTIEHMEIVPS